MRRSFAFAALHVGVLRRRLLMHHLTPVLARLSPHWPLPAWKGESMCGLVAFLGAK